MADFLSHRAMELLLRLPPLYLMDTILMQDLGKDIWSEHQDNSVTLTAEGGQRVRVTEAPKGFYANASDDLGAAEGAIEDLYAKLYDSSLLSYSINLSLALVFYLSSAFVITLPLRQLLFFYAHLAAALCLPLAYFSHRILADTLAQISAGASCENAEWFLHRGVFQDYLSLETRAIAANYLIQTALGLLLSWVLKLHFDSHDQLLKTITFSLFSPNIFAILQLPLEVVELSMQFSLLLPALLCLLASKNIVEHGYRTVSATITAGRQFISNFGLNTFLENEWTRLRVPSLLRVFWLTRLGLQLAIELFRLSGAAGNLAGYMTLPDAGSLALSTVQALSKSLFTRGAETLIAVLGMTSVVSSVCHYLGSLFHLILNSDDEEEKSVASVSAILFFVLALQTGLTSLEPDKRFARLCKNLCLLLTALFHFIHNMVSPALMSLSASHNINSKKHVRALMICVFLVLAPVGLMTYLWYTFTVGTWLLAVSAFCIEVVVKVTVTVSVYVLFLYDQVYQDGTWECLDDAVYYVKAAGNSVEFIFAVFLFFNGGWILFYESGGTIRAFMMLIHAYCNIWLEAKTGWQTFMKRRTAVAKINSLPDATEAQLLDHNDVCAICYQEMTNAKLTRCKHYFHGVCLRKWLYVQDSCPLCHGALYSRAANAAENDGDAENAAENAAESNADAANVELIDNDEVEEQEEGSEDSSVEEEEEEGDRQRRDLLCLSATSSDHSDNDLIYDSMEDFGGSSDEGGDESAPEEEIEGDGSGVQGR